MSKLYVSGAMSLHKDNVEDPWHFKAFAEAASALKAVGFETEDPGEKGLVDGWTWEDYLKYDLKQMIDCDGVATLDDWIFSAGAQLEVHVARRLGIPVFSVDEWLDRAEL